jgi:PPK2 family polyphosphate:nucleotide phosphotransferase
MSNLLTKLAIKPEAKQKLGGIDPSFGGFRLYEMPAPAVHALRKPPDPPPSTDFRKEFFVEPGTRVKLDALDPTYHGRYDSRGASLPEMHSLEQRLDRLQNLLYAEKKHSLLIVLQGLDASGKDGVIRHILSAVNPMGCRAVAFKRPKPEELDHDFLWRVHPHLPAKGEVSIFNRSHYEDVLVVRVHQFSDFSVWSKRYDLINDFERLLVTENNTTVLKFFLHISKKEQLARFKQRLDDPARRWKISEADYKERAFWDRYVDAFEDMLYKTSTRCASWFVIPSDHKWFRDLAVSQIIARTLEDLGMKWPEPSVNLADIRRRYHDAFLKDETPDH